MFPLLMKELPADYKNKIVYNFSKNMYSLKKLPCEESVRRACESGICFR